MHIHLNNHRDNALLSTELCYLPVVQPMAVLEGKEDTISAWSKEWNVRVYTHDKSRTGEPDNYYYYY